MDRSRALRVALIVVGVAFIFAVYPLMLVWPGGWTWQPDHPAYQQMIIGIYATLGVFLILASRHPMENLSLIWFTIWSSVVHATVMAVHAMRDPGERGHLPGDVAALYLFAAVLAWLTPRSGGSGG